jgi:hypothetical protein
MEKGSFVNPLWILGVLLSSLLAPSLLIPLPDHEIGSGILEAAWTENSPLDASPSWTDTPREFLGPPSSCRGDRERRRVLPEKAEAFWPPTEGGIKDLSYALLFHAHLYGATGGSGWKARGEEIAQRLVELQGKRGLWRAQEGERGSSYSLLESSMATWALSEAYLYGVVEGEEVERALLLGGDGLTRLTSALGFAEGPLGLKPNALGFAALALSRAHDAAREMREAGARKRSLLYRREALELSERILQMQNPDGSWYDGPYGLPWEDWKRTSAWYQSMAWSGPAVASTLLQNPAEKARYLEGVKRGVLWTDRLRRGDGTYRGVRYANGSLSEDALGTPLLLQGFALACEAGVGVAGDRALSLLESLDPPPGGWDAHIAFGTAILLNP